MNTSTRAVARIEFDNGVSLAINETNLPMVIGRGTTTDMCVPFSEVSRQHCELYLENNKLYIRDSSTNGTRVGNTYLNKGSFLPIDQRTSVYLADETRLCVTPLDLPKDLTQIREETDDERSVDDRRGGERRQQKKRRENVVSVDFERRTRHARRSLERRVLDRRAQGEC